MKMWIVKQVKSFYKLLFVEVEDYSVLKLHGQFHCNAVKSVIPVSYLSFTSACVIQLEIVNVTCSSLNDDAYKWFLDILSNMIIVQ